MILYKLIIKKIKRMFHYIKKNANKSLEDTTPDELSNVLISLIKMFIVDFTSIIENNKKKTFEKSIYSSLVRIFVEYTISEIEKYNRENISMILDLLEYLFDTQITEIGRMEKAGIYLPKLYDNMIVKRIDEIIERMNDAENDITKVDYAAMLRNIHQKKISSEIDKKIEGLELCDKIVSKIAIEAKDKMVSNSTSESIKIKCGEILKRIYYLNFSQTINEEIKTLDGMVIRNGTSYQPSDGYYQHEKTGPGYMCDHQSVCYDETEVWVETRPEIPGREPIIFKIS